MMQRRVSIPIVLVVLLLGALAVFLVEGEAFLKVGHDNRDIVADAIVVLAGAAGEDNLRVTEGNALFHRGCGRYIILPLRHPTFKWRWAIENYRLSDPVQESKILIGRSLPDDKQVIYDYGGTYLEALKTIDIMRQHQLDSAIVISSAYHMRRVRVAFENANRDQALRFYYHPVANNKPDGGIWWMDYQYCRHILKEYKKLIAAYFIYRK